VPLIGSYHADAGAFAARVTGSRQAGRLVHAYVRWLYGSCERILVPSEAMRASLLEQGWPHDRLARWTCGVDTAMFSPERRSPTLRRRWRVSDERPAILYPGRLSAADELTLLVSLRELLDTYRLPYRFVLAGDGALARKLRHLLPEAVFTGAIDQESLGEVMASADLCIFPSETETAGILEAQASGVPALVADRGPAREQMVADVTGYVCAAGCERDFCWHAARLLVDLERRRAMGRAARLAALTREWPEALRPLFACYRALGRRGAPARRRRLSSRAAAPAS
jgi:glycosyltransferase involved in cell wall biosynthesis